MSIYTYKGTQYQIVREKVDKDDEGRAEQILRDFQHCESMGDWMTIKNRITNGLMWGWLRELKKEIRNGDTK